MVCKGAALHIYCMLFRARSQYRMDVDTMTFVSGVGKHGEQGWLCSEELQEVQASMSLLLLLFLTPQSCASIVNILRIEKCSNLLLYQTCFKWLFFIISLVVLNVSKVDRKTCFFIQFRVSSCRRQKNQFPCPFGKLKGSLTRDFRLQVFFMNQCPPGPQVFNWGRFEFFRKFAEIFARHRR